MILKLRQMCSNVLQCVQMCSNVLVLAVTSCSGRVLDGDGFFFGGNGCFLVVTSDNECL